MQWTDYRVGAGIGGVPPKTLGEITRKLDILEFKCDKGDRGCEQP